MAVNAACSLSGKFAVGLLYWHLLTLCEVQMSCTIDKGTQEVWWTQATSVQPESLTAHVTFTPLLTWLTLRLFNETRHSLRGLSPASRCGDPGSVPVKSLSLWWLSCAGTFLFPVLRSSAVSIIPPKLHVHSYVTRPHIACQLTS